MKRMLTLYFRLISISIRSQMYYRLSFLMDLVTTGLMNGVYFLGLVLILERFGNILGWSLGEIAFLAGMVEMSFAVMDMVFSGFDSDRFSQMVRVGSFDQMLLRPVSITLQVFGSQFWLRRLGKVTEGLAIFIFALAVTSIDWTLLKLLYLPVVFLSQVVAFGALFMIGATITFWTVQSVEAMNILTYGGNELMTYPASIYPGWLRNFFTFIIPFIFLNYLPGVFFLGKPDPLGFPAFAVFLAPLVALGLMVFAAWFWRFGVNHYQSTGT